MVYQVLLHVRHNGNYIDFKVIEIEGDNEEFLMTKVNEKIEELKKNKEFLNLFMLASMLMNRCCNRRNYAFINAAGYRSGYHLRRCIWKKTLHQ